MNKLLKVLPVAFILAGLVLPKFSWSDTASNTASLEQRLDNLEAQVAELKQ